MELWFGDFATTDSIFLKSDVPLASADVRIGLPILQDLDMLGHTLNAQPSNAKPDWLSEYITPFCVQNVRLVTSLDGRPTSACLWPQAEWT